ncbi:hypothetical protein [Chryseobacterium mucoviscidosis]|uniref:hypothetical protein n=1 Tax=Chryseobacterium mucoviscidosis TaxID=1945581 RepID=UPI0031D1D609
MENNSKELINLIETIITQELNEVEKENYKIEGEEFIDKILKTGSTQIDNQNSNNTTKFDFGLSPDALELIKQGTTFSTVIISIINIYLECKKIKKSAIESNTSSFELKEKIYKTLMEQDLPNDMKEKIKEKYSAELLNIFEKAD